MSVSKIHFEGLTNLLEGKHPHDFMVLFYADWCGYCKKFRPVYEALETEIPKYEINLASPMGPPMAGGSETLTYAHALKQRPSIATEHYKIDDLSKFVGGYPTTIFFTNAGKVEKDIHVVAGGRTTEQLTEKLKEVYGRTT